MMEIIEHKAMSTWRLRRPVAALALLVAPLAAMLCLLAWGPRWHRAEAVLVARAGGMELAAADDWLASQRALLSRPNMLAGEAAGDGWRGAGPAGRLDVDTFNGGSDELTLVVRLDCRHGPAEAREQLRRIVDAYLARRQELARSSRQRELEALAARGESLEHSAVEAAAELEGLEHTLGPDVVEAADAATTRPAGELADAIARLEAELAETGALARQINAELGRVDEPGIPAGLRAADPMLAELDKRAVEVRILLNLLEPRYGEDNEQVPGVREELARCEAEIRQRLDAAARELEARIERIETQIAILDRQRQLAIAAGQARPRLEAARARRAQARADLQLHARQRREALAMIEAGADGPVVELLGLDVDESPLGPPAGLLVAAALVLGLSMLAAHQLLLRHASLRERRREQPRSTRQAVNARPSPHGGRGAPSGDGDETPAGDSSAWQRVLAPRGSLVVESEAGWELSSTAEVDIQRAWVAINRSRSDSLLVIEVDEGLDAGRAGELAVALSLAAQRRLRVALLDACEKPVLHAVLTQPRTPGLAEAGAGDVVLEQTARRVTDRLDLYAAGARPPQGRQLGAMLDSIREGYDVVLVFAGSRRLRALGQVVTLTAGPGPSVPAGGGARAQDHGRL